MHGQTISERCGGHIHIGADYLTSEKSWEALTEIWANTEEILYLISNTEEELPRNGIAEYARPMAIDIEKMFKEDSVALNEDKDTREILKKIQDLERHFGINFLNLGKVNKNTIEFRLANGTVDYNTWIENVNLFGGIVVLAEKIGIMQNKKEEKSEEEKEILRRFELLRTEELSAEEKLEILLDLVILNGDKETYINRYNVNSKLIKEDSEISEQLKGSKLVKPFSIGKKVLTGKNSVTEEDYKKMTEIIRIEFLTNEKSTKGDD